VQEQQAVSRVTRQHCSYFFHFTAVLPSPLLPIPIGNPVRRDPVPTVLPWMWSPLPRFPRGAVTAVFPPSPLPCRPLVMS